MRSHLTIVIAVAALGAASAGVAGDTFDVPDGDVFGLIVAINLANANGVPDTINLAPDGVYTLTEVRNLVTGPTGLPAITSEITVNGHGAIIQRSADAGTPEFRILFVDITGDLTLNDATISGGGLSSNSGGGIINDGILTITNSTISGNSTAAAQGGGIENDGTLTITNSTISANSAGSSRGGGINNNGTLTVTNSAISSNMAGVGGGGGGGIRNSVIGTATITSSTISANSAASGGGGGIFNDGTLTLTNSTISGNTSFSIGGGIFSSGTLAVTYATISGNSASPASGGGIRTSGTLTLANAIVANSEGNEIIGAYTDVGHNIIEDGFGVSDPTSMAGDPNLGPLADNGGPTLTHALLPGSIAIDAGDCAAGTITEDQRGVSRPQGTACDIGAFEFEPCLADIDGDGDADVADFFAFVLAFAGGDPIADINGDGSIDVGDFFAFVAAFAAGCP